MLPTPAVALLAEDGGAVVSASHNPAEYNGVKFFRGGWKLEDAEEEAIEACSTPTPSRRAGAVREATGLGRRATSSSSASASARRSRACSVVLDCANGAMTEVGAGGLRAARSVRHGGRERARRHEHQRRLRRHRPRGSSPRVVPEAGADLGVAFDGDGDRMLAVDAAGNEVDGDQIVAVLALHLGVDLVAVTQMTNLGFHRLMAERGIRVVTTDVGDRYVLEALRAEGGVLGGEQRSNPSVCI